MPYRTDRYWSDMIMQPIAMRDYYKVMWPGCQIEELDKALQGSLGQLLDIAGADKLVRLQSGAVAFLGQRFRRHKYSNFDDFSIRFHRDSGMKTEFDKIISAIRANTLLAGYYAWGMASDGDKGFERFRILNFFDFVHAASQGILPEPLIRVNNATPDNPDGDGTSAAYWPWKKLRNYVLREWIMTPPATPALDLAKTAKQKKHETEMAEQQRRLTNWNTGKAREV